MKYKQFFSEYKSIHKRHDPPGSEDADVNNDGKVDKNDKYILAKRRLYKQYQAAQQNKKASDFSTPKLENNMIRMTGLVNLQPLKEEEKWIQKAIEKPGALHKQLGVPAGEKIPAGKLAAAAEKGGKLGKRARLAQTLKKLKEMELTPDQEKKIEELSTQMEELTAGQKKLDVDKDGKIEGDDLAKLRAGKKDEVVLENEDHEVSMAQSTLDSIIRHATELKGKVGMQEKDIPAWIQDHITNAENYIDQANTSFHDYEQEKGMETDKPVDQDLDAMKEELNEVAPEGWEKTVKAMKKHKEIDNPWALANWMKKKGYHPKKEEAELEEAKLSRAGNYDTPSSPDYLGDKKRTRSAPNTWVERPAGGWSSEKKVKNPETGKEILATTAAKDPSHPAHNAAKSALGKK